MTTATTEHGKTIRTILAGIKQLAHFLPARKDPSAELEAQCSVWEHLEAAATIAGANQLRGSYEYSTAASRAYHELADAIRNAYSKLIDDLNEACPDYVVAGNKLWGYTALSGTQSPVSCDIDDCENGPADYMVIAGNARHYYCDSHLDCVLESRCTEFLESL